MSQLDVIEAKKALRARLAHWEVPDAAKKADGFIDDLVAKGWIMQAQREARPQPPHRHEQCRDCGRHVNTCLCETEPTPYGSPPTTADPRRGADLVRAAMGGKS